MSALEQALTDYLRLRRSLGHELAEAAWLLPGFVAYLDAHGSRTVTIEATLAWAQQAQTSGPSFGPRRMTAVRGFARYLAGIDAATEVPPLGLMPHRQRWRRPFIYSPADIDTVIAQARQTIVSPLRAVTYGTLIGLLAATGMRIGEAIKLDRGDVDWAEGVLLIRESKFGKSRLVPLAASSMTALQDYAGLRDELVPRPGGSELFRVPHPQTAALCRGLPDLPAARRRLRCRSRCAMSSAAARPAAHLRGPHPARLVSRRRGRRGQDPIAVDLPGTSRTELHLLVPLGRS